MAKKIMIYGEEAGGSSDLAAAVKIAPIEGMDAQNVQSAIEEVSDNLTSIGNYSTTQAVLVGNWIDGKKLYRKCFNKQIGTVSGYTDVFNETSQGHNVVKFEVFTNCAGGTTPYYLDGTYTIDSSNAMRYQIVDGALKMIGTPVKTTNYQYGVVYYTTNS